LRTASLHVVCRPAASKCSSSCVPAWSRSSFTAAPSPYQSSSETLALRPRRPNKVGFCWWTAQERLCGQGTTSGGPAYGNLLTTALLPSSLVPFQNSTSALRSPPPPCQSPSREEKKTRRQDRWSITATRGSQVPAVFPHLVAAERPTTRTIVDVFPATLSVVGPSLLPPDQVVGIVQ
jgi:hypothetical protein